MQAQSVQNEILLRIGAAILLHYDAEENVRVYGSYEEINVRDVQNFIAERRQTSLANGDYRMMTYFHVLLRHSETSQCVLEDMRDLMVYHVMAENELEKMVLDMHLFNIIMGKYYL